MPDQLSVIRNGNFKQTMLGGYDRFEVDDYISRLHQRIDELEQTHSPQGAVRRALEQVGDEVSGILQRAHDTSSQVTEKSRREADDRIEAAKRTAASLTAEAEVRVRELDIDTDRIWAERDRIVSDMRDLAAQLVALAEAAAARFPPEEIAEAPHPGEVTEAFVIEEELDEPADAGD